MLNGRRFTLGPYDSPKRQRGYGQPVSESLRNGRQITVDPRQFTFKTFHPQNWTFPFSLFPPPSAIKSLLAFNVPTKG